MTILSGSGERGFGGSWAQFAPCEHVVQFYESDDVLAGTLEEFIGSGLRSGEGAIAIATGAHLDLLENRLRAAGIDLARARSTDQYIPLDAEKLFDFFSATGQFDGEMFFKVVKGALQRCRRGGRSVRVFGELVAVLWARKDYATALQLERSWQRECAAENISLLCSYPRKGFAPDSSSLIEDICASHSRAVFQ